MFLSTVFVLLAAVQSPTVVTVYASPRGSDTLSGSKTAPVRSVERALAVLRGSNSDNRRIVLTPGDYTIRETLDLDEADNGTTIEGAGKARLMGGQLLKGWQPLTDAVVLNRLSLQARKNVVAIDLNELGIDTGALTPRGFKIPNSPVGLELFIDGKPAQIARWPNAGDWLKIGETKDDKTFTYQGKRPVCWRDPDEAWVFGYFHHDWADTYSKVARLDPLTGTVTVNEELPYGCAPGRRFYFFNVIEELDTPGEWYLDREVNKLYLWPIGPIERSKIVASTLKGPMFRLKGASDVRISGISMEAGRDGAVRIEGGARNQVESCVIRNFGTYGVSIRGATDSGVSGCDLTGLGTFGIELVGGDRTTLTPAGLYADDNHIWAYSRWERTYQAGVAIEGVGNRASHNLIEDAPHNAVLLSGNDHVVEYNDVRRVCTETGDSGAVYMGRDTTMRGNVIRFNRFRQTGPTVTTEGSFTMVMSVYLDDQWSGTTVFGNIFEDDGTGVLVGGGRDNTVENNVFVGKSPAIHFDARGRGWAKSGLQKLRDDVVRLNATQPPYSARYPELANILNEDIATPKGNRVVRNVCAGGKWFRFEDSTSEKDFAEYSDNVTAKGSTLDGALAQAPKGFKKIPVDKIGLTTKRRPIG